MTYVPGRKRLGFAAVLLTATGPAAYADMNEWDAAPEAWAEGLDVDAFCEPGEWYFESFGDRARAKPAAAEAAPHREQAVHALHSPQSEVAIAADWLLVVVGKRAASWLPDGPRADETTHLRIMRDGQGELTIEAYADELRAAWRVYEPKATACVSGKSLRIDAHDAVHRQGNTSLALASDGSLIVRQDGIDEFFWPLMLIPTGSHFARFPAAVAEGRPQAPVN